MNISKNWLKEFLDIDLSTEELSHRLTMLGLEVEGVEKYEPIKGGLEGVVIGEVIACEKHPDADKLSLTKVDVGQNEPLSIVCGAPNVAKGQKVCVALVGTTLYPSPDKPLKIEKAKIRGQVSMGMICAEDELGMGKSHAGIIVLDTNLPNGTPIAQYFNIPNDEVISIGLTPNRIDAASHFGVARDLGASLKKVAKFPSLKNFRIDNKSLPIEVVVEAKEACPRYSGISIKGVKVQDSPEWLQHRLKAIGLTPINNIVDITNYVLHGLGQPMHAFDTDKIKGKKVIVKTLPKDSEFISLDNQKRKLSDNDLMICNGEGEGMCIAGVFGGINSGITSETKNVFLESAYFHPDWIRKTALYHGLKTDASFRFERGTDPNMTVKALKFATILIKEIAGGEVASDIIDIVNVCDNQTHLRNKVKDVLSRIGKDTSQIDEHDYSTNFNKTVSVKFKNIDRLIGKKLDREEIKDILTRLEIEILEENDESMSLLVPAYRVDVLREADVIEDILRIYGFEEIKVNEKLKTDYLASFPEYDAEKMQFSVTQMLAGSGANEIMTNSLTTRLYAEKLGNVNLEENVLVMNSLSAGLDVMRQSLIFSGLEVIAHNLNRKQENLKLFEFGKIYQKKGEKYHERKQLALFVTGNEHEESWLAKPKKVEFHTLAALLDKVLLKMNVGNYEKVNLQDNAFAYCLSYVKNNKTIAKIGLLKPSLGKILDIKREVYYAEVEWETILNKYKNPNLYKEIPKFPEVRRDLSMVLDKNVSFDNIQKLAFKTEKQLLKSINVFDVYEGANLGEGKKSYALSFTLLDDSQTLTDKVIDKTMEKLMSVFEKELGAIIRKG
ncbi:MAG: phenylalanine--tRNA ligase subunit beta [Flammeovirgaceae bacterium]